MAEPFKGKLMKPEVTFAYLAANLRQVNIIYSLPLDKVTEANLAYPRLMKSRPITKYSMKLT